MPCTGWRFFDDVIVGWCRVIDQNYNLVAMQNSLRILINGVLCVMILCEAEASVEMPTAINNYSES